MTKSVFIVGGDAAIARMFTRRDYKIVNDPEDADFLQFTGGADVDPMLYYEPKHPSTNSSPVRDSIEANIYNIFFGKKRMLGICRGGQFLNVMCGGLLWQDVNNHAIFGTHAATDTETQEVFQVTSTHHQMMIEGEGSNVLLRAGLSTRKENGWESVTVNPNKMGDIEAVLYPESEVLCFQPHPEYVDFEEPTERLYFYYINQYLKG